MTEREFIATWASIFGGPPAAMLDRNAMIDLLFDEGPATLVARRAAGWDQAEIARSRLDRVAPAQV